MTECRCLIEGPQRPDITDEHYLGCDKTSGRFADVTLRRCSRCKRLWLRYSVEYEAFTASGRWAEAPIDDDDAAAMTPETAAAFLDRAEFAVFGGCYYGHAGHRGRGPFRWGICL
jgi:hypothetical protein